MLPPGQRVVQMRGHECRVRAVHAQACAGGHLFFLHTPWQTHGLFHDTPSMDALELLLSEALLCVC